MSVNLNLRRTTNSREKITYGQTKNQFYEQFKLARAFFGD